MPRAALLVAVLALAACHSTSRGDAVRQRYDERADAVENAASMQPTATAKHIYRARADALREEGRDRERGLEGGAPTGRQGTRSMAQGSGQ